MGKVYMCSLTGELNYLCFLFCVAPVLSKMSFSKWRLHSSSSHFSSGLDNGNLVTLFTCDVSLRVFFSPPA